MHAPAAGTLFQYPADITPGGYPCRSYSALAAIPFLKESVHVREVVRHPHRERQPWRRRRPSRSCTNARGWNASSASCCIRARYGRSRSGRACESAWLRHVRPPPLCRSSIDKGPGTPIGRVVNQDTGRAKFLTQRVCPCEVAALAGLLALRDQMVNPCRVRGSGETVGDCWPGQSPEREVRVLLEQSE